MAAFFFDSSALAKRYHVESGTAAVLAIFDLEESRIFVSRLSLVEIRSAFAIKVRPGAIEQADVEALQIMVNDDLASGRLNVLAIERQRSVARST